MRVTQVLCARKLVFRKKHPRWAPKPALKKAKFKNERKYREFTGHRDGSPRTSAMPGMKLSTEMKDRSQSCVDDIRNPKRAKQPNQTWNVVRGDYVQVIHGEDKGKRGDVIEVVRMSNKVVVRGVGFVKAKLQHKNGTLEDVSTEGPIDVSRVQLVCPKTDQPTKIKIMYIDGQTRVRVAEASGAIIPKPAILRQRRAPRQGGERDTDPGVVLRMSYEEPAMITKAREWMKMRIERHQHRMFRQEFRVWQEQNQEKMYESVAGSDLVRGDIRWKRREAAEEEAWRAEKRREELFVEKQRERDEMEERERLKTEGEAEETSRLVTTGLRQALEFVKGQEDYVVASDWKKPDKSAKKQAKD